MRICDELCDELCDECDSRIRQNKKFQHNLNELKRQAFDKNGIMKPYYIQ